MWRKFSNKNTHFSGISITLEELISLRSKVINNPTCIKKELFEKNSLQNIAKIRGRGLEFDSTREYQHGDDIRRMAWRVTARNLKPHVKIYYEEKERPVWLAVDLSPSLYFGTRCMFKSVSSIKRAAFLGWSYLLKRERVGAFIATPNKTWVHRPKLQEREFLLILKSLAEYSAIQPAFTENNCLQSLLVTMQEQIRAGNLIFIVSDFLQFDMQEKKLILHLAQYAQVNLIFVYDPLEALPPPAYQYVITDGQTRALFNMVAKENRHEYQQQFQNKLNDLIEFSRKYNISLEVLRTDQELGM